jgi:hypothetical protein
MGVWGLRPQPAEPLAFLEPYSAFN